MKKTIIIFTFLTMIFAFGCSANNDAKKTENTIKSISTDSGNIYYHMKGLDKPFNVLFISDCHITLEDERGEEFYEFSKRMGGDFVEPENYGKSNGREKNLIATLEKAKEKNVELVLLCGDIINFPSEASVELVKEIMDESGLNWAYTTGNHDWHYEGMEGTSTQLRETWINKNLLPLFKGENPYYSSRIIEGINFVLIDNSTFEINEEQLKFFKEQTEKEYPIVLSMHIPLYVPGTKPGNYGCGHPDWNSETDPLYELERRNPWRAEGHTQTTFDFRDLAFNSPNVIGIFAGHTHSEAVNFFNNKTMFVAANNFKGASIMMHFIPFK